MRAYRISLPAVAILLAISVWPPVAEARPGASQCGPVPSPSPGEFANYLRGVSAASADDVWAVGYQRHTAFDSSRTLIEHWNGASWEAIAGQDHGDGHNILYSVAAISPTDAWAVGTYQLGDSGVYRTLVEHWDGAAWSIVLSPNPR